MQTNEVGREPCWNGLRQLEAKAEAALGEMRFEPADRRGWRSGLVRISVEASFRRRAFYSAAPAWVSAKRPVAIKPVGHERQPDFHAGNAGSFI